MATTGRLAGSLKPAMLDNSREQLFHNTDEMPFESRRIVLKASRSSMTPTRRLDGSSAGVSNRSVGSTRAASVEQFDQHLATGGEHLRLQDASKAKAEFLEALELRPDDSKALGLLGLAYFQLDSFGDALPIYERLVELNASDASFWFNLGVVHLKLGKPELAIIEFTKSRELDPSQSRTVSYLGLAYARQGSFARAYEAFLQSGDTELSKEMERHLDDHERDAIRKRVATGEPAPASGANEIPEDDAEPLNEDELEFVSNKTRELTDDSHIVSLEIETPEEPKPKDKPSKSKSKQPSNGGAGLSGSWFGGDAAVAEGIAPAEGLITKAVHRAAPSKAAHTAAIKTAAGHEPPRSLTEFATSRLIRPEDGEHPFELAIDGALIVRVRGEVMSRTENVIVSGGDLGFEAVTRRVRGEMTDQLFGESDGKKLFSVTGTGFLVAGAGDGTFTAVSLDDDILYVRETLVFAFEEALSWENGSVPGAKPKIHVVQFRGSGAVALRTAKPLTGVKLASEKVLYVDAALLAGWVGRVVPRLVAPVVGGGASASFVECTGEGVVLIEQQT